MFDILKIHEIDKHGAILDPAKPTTTIDGVIRIKKVAKKKTRNTNDTVAENYDKELKSDNEGSSESSSDYISDLETALIIPSLTVRGKNIFALAHSSPKIFKVYWLQYRDSKLHIITYHVALYLNIDENNSFNSEGSNRDEALISYVSALYNMIEKPCWIDIKGIPALLLVRVDLTIDMYIMKDNKIIKCKGLTQPFDSGCMPVASSLLESNDDDSNDSDAFEVRHAVRQMRLGWYAGSRCLTMAYVKPSDSGDRFIVKTFAIKI